MHTRDSADCKNDTWQHIMSMPRMVLGMIGTGLVALVIVSSPPALAEAQMVPAEQITSMAKPLKTQQVDKGKIWLLFILGASSLFGATVVLENNEAWFPAISKANRAVKAAQARIEERERQAQREDEAAQTRLKVVEEEREQDARIESAVLSGIQEARNLQLETAEAVNEEGAQNLKQVTEITVTNEEVVENNDDGADHIHDTSTPSGIFPSELNAEQVQTTETYVSTSSNSEPTDIMDNSNTNKSTPSTSSSLFELTTEQIEASIKAKKKESLIENMSLEEIQKEIEARKKTPGS